jgi:protein SCO1/2
MAFGRFGFGIFLACVLSLRALAAPGSITPAMPGVSFEQRIGETLPHDAAFRDETGHPVRLGSYFGSQPAILLFGYTRCPQLCSVVSNGTVETLRDLRATAGQDFSVIYVSIDPTDTPRDMAALKRRDTGRYGRTGSAPGWHYLSGEENTIRRVADAAGFHYTYDERQKLYAHASGFLVLTPDGRISKYFLGVDYDAKDVASALERAAAGRTGQSVYNLILVCARGLGITGKYGRVIWVSLEIAVSLTIIVVFGGIGWMLWQERRQQNHPAARPVGCDGRGALAPHDWAGAPPRRASAPRSPDNAAPRPGGDRT